MYYPSNKLDNNSRVWIYQADREIESNEQVEIVQELTTFITNWTAHQKDLKASFEILLNRFIAIMVDESNIGATGCSIDKCLHFIQKLEQKYKIILTDRLLLAYKDNDEIKTLPKNVFEKALQSGKLNADTIVFNNLISKKSELQSAWQVPIRNSWHSVMLKP